MQNIPKTIYLQIGEDCPTDDGEDFNTLYGVSWCSERINENDIEYVLKEKTLSEGDRVFSYDIEKGICYGTLHKNTEYPNVSEWYINYDDGEECAVLDINLVFKA